MDVGSERRANQTKQAALSSEVKRLKNKSAAVEREAVVMRDRRFAAVMSNRNGYNTFLGRGSRDQSNMGSLLAR